MAGKKGSSTSSSSVISFGNCLVEIEGKKFVCEPSEKQLTISVAAKAKINISVDTSMDSRGNLSTDLKSQDAGFLLKDCSFLLVNPNNADDQSKSLLQEVLKIYLKELPTMNYAANTGRESQFLERSILNGKYNTLILRSNSCDALEKVMAAVSYQIIPTDNHYAEIPLAAVRSSYQNKGIGQLLFKELRDRLQKVGISTIFCWGDDESEGFWVKQGFISIGKVDNKGKARRLPIKAGIRRALCFPGGSTLMISHLKNDVGLDYPLQCNLCSTEIGALSPCNCVNTTLGLVKAKLEGSPKIIAVDKPLIHQIPMGKTPYHASMRDGCFRDKEIVEGITAGASRGACWSKLGSCSKMEYNTLGKDMVLADTGCDAKGSAYCFGKGVKRQISETLSSSLKSKRVRGGHHIQCWPCTGQGIPYDHGESNLDSDVLPLGIFHNEAWAVEISKDPNDLTHEGSHGKGNNSVGDLVVSEGRCTKIMFMNIADETKKAWLAKVVLDLGGSVASDGNLSTHVITGKVRRTLNFCMALCSGAWIVSPNWLKASFREGKFLGEEHFILEDEDYLSKYKCKLKDAVLRGKANPCALFNGYHLCLARHIQPSNNILSAIIKSAGGHVISKLGSVKDPTRTIFLACEEDMAEALVAAKKGVRTFNSDWFLGCVMRQELDLQGPQFAESL